jgi:phage-related protein
VGKFLIIYLVLLVPVCLLVLSLSRRARVGQDTRHAAELQELEASRELIDRLLDAAVDRRDVDPVLAPIVIDEIRTHQRSLRRRRDDGSSDTP